MIPNFLFLLILSRELYTGLFLELSLSKSVGVHYRYLYVYSLYGIFYFPGIDTRLKGPTAFSVLPKFRSEVAAAGFNPEPPGRHSNALINSPTAPPVECGGVQ